MWPALRPLLSALVSSRPAPGVYAASVRQCSGTVERQRVVMSAPEAPQHPVAAKRSVSPDSDPGDRRRPDDRPPASPTRLKRHRSQSPRKRADPDRFSGDVAQLRHDPVSAEEMLEKVRQWLPVRHFTQGTSHQFTFVSYNVLSQHLFGQMQDLYVGAEPANTAWAARGPRLWRQLVELRPDIVCLQEVEEHDVDDFWKPRCDKEGLALVYKRRTGNDKRDGCALLYRRARFQLVDSATVEFMQGSASLDRDNVAIVVRLRSACGDLTVACTHLLYNPRRHDIKLAQTALLLAEVDRVAWCGVTRRHTPVLIAGDFNLEPHTPVYQFVTCGWLQYGGMSRRHLTPYGGGSTLLSPLLPARLGVSPCCQHVAVTERRQLAPAEPEPARLEAERRLVALRHSERVWPPPVTFVPADGGCLGHQLRLRSAYRHDPPHRHTGVTTRQGRWITVDYIFHSDSPPGSPRLELLSRLALPSAGLCERLKPYPSEALPSDHFLLAARFRLTSPCTDRRS